MSYKMLLLMLTWQVTASKILITIPDDHVDVDVDVDLGGNGFQEHGVVLLSLSLVAGVVTGK